MTGTPVVDDGTVFVGDWTGDAHPLDARTGDEVWDHDPQSGSRRAGRRRRHAGGGGHVRRPSWRSTARPATRSGRPRRRPPQAVVLSARRSSPTTLWSCGVGSFEVFVPGDPPTFRGHVVALDAATGDERWRFWVTAGEARGARRAVWSSPAADTERGVLYIGTGQAAYAPPAPPRSDGLIALDLVGRRAVVHPVHRRRRLDHRPAHGPRRRRGRHPQPVQRRWHGRRGGGRQGRHLLALDRVHGRDPVGGRAHRGVGCRAASWPRPRWPAAPCS